MGAAAAALLLADGRLPAGGYAHSGGLEPAVRAGRVHDAETLQAFLAARARTAGLVAAAFAAGACQAAGAADETRLAALDAALEARIPSPAQRSVSRQLGRQMLRAMRSIAPRTVSRALGGAPHQALAVGAACAAFRLAPPDAALVALHESVAGPVAAAVRLMSLDPFATHAALARLGPELDGLRDRAVGHAAGPVEEMPCAATPLLDIGAERHAMQERRLFAS